MRPLNVSDTMWRYRGMVGVGGIGTGRFFALRGNHTLGREESRAGHFLDRRDYCKLHIVCHYVQALLGGAFAVVPIGKVGDDDGGRTVWKEMAEAGLDMRHVVRSSGEQTLYSLCLVYPDGSGGNLTTDDSACAHMSAGDVDRARPEFARLEGNGIALALPEVPQCARRRLLELGTAHGMLRVASFTSEEMPLVVADGLLASVDLLAVNLDEARSVGGQPVSEGTSRDAVESAVGALLRANSALHMCITAGNRGSWSWDGEQLYYVGALPAAVVSAAGAGDAYLAGVIVALTAGLPLRQAQELGTLVAGLSVTSPHTIHSGIDRVSLRDFAASTQAPLSDAVRQLLNG